MKHEKDLDKDIEFRKIKSLKKFKNQGIILHNIQCVNTN